MIREPLLQFALFGVILFSILSWWKGSSKNIINVTPAIVQGLVAERQNLLGREIQTEEQNQLIEDYIDQQVLLAEAIKLGLDKADPRITNLLADRMRQLLDETIPEPNESQIDSFYRLESSRYRSPDLISFDHIFYASENSDGEDYERILYQLESKEINWDQIGDKFWLGSSLKGYSKEALSTMLGDSFTDQIFQLDSTRWFGPLESARGIHLVRVVEKSEGQTLSLELARSLVIQDWLRMHKKNQLKRKIDKIKKTYTIEISLPPPG